jgi:hypothetical protein
MATSNQTAPSLEESRQLYAAAARIKELAPWAWMEESQIFGVQNPETGELGFVSVMGMAGEHFAISVYQGAEGLYGFWDMEEAGPLMDPQMLIEIPQLQASFEDRDAMQKRDRDVMKQLGLKFRGANAWPLFRSYAVGYMPWHLTAAETRFLTCALEQTLAVAPRVKADPDLLWGEDDSVEGDYLVRVSHQENNRLVWEDRMQPVPEPESPPISIMMDMNALKYVQELPPSRLEVELDFFSMPTPVQDKGERPYFPYMLMLVEGNSGMILGFEMVKPEATREILWGQIPLKVVQKLADFGARPQELRVASDLLLNLLQPLARELPCKLKQVEHLPGLDPAKDALFQFGGLW